MAGQLWSSLTFILDQISSGRPLVQRGVDVYKVQRLLGHKTNLMTQQYAHHSPESLYEGVNVLDATHQQRVSTNLPLEAIVGGHPRTNILGTI